jgi:hypothetical protein
VVVDFVVVDFVVVGFVVGDLDLSHYFQNWNLLGNLYYHKELPNFRTIRLEEYQRM